LKGDLKVKITAQAIKLMLLALMILLLGNIKTFAKEKDSKETIKEYREEIQLWTEEREFYKKILGDPDIWVLPALHIPFFVPKNHVIDSVSSHYRKECLEKALSYDDKELAKRIAEIAAFTKAFKSELTRQIAEIDYYMKRRREMIAQLKAKALAPASSKLPESDFSVVFEDGFEGEESASTVYNWDTDKGIFKKWKVTEGAVDLVVEGGKKFVDLDGTYGWGKTGRDRAIAGKLESNPIQLIPGTYRLEFRLKGNPYQGGRPSDAKKPK